MAARRSPYVDGMAVRFAVPRANGNDDHTPTQDAEAQATQGGDACVAPSLGSRLQRPLDQRTHELAEAVGQQAATAEVLKIIVSRPREAADRCWRLSSGAHALSEARNVTIFELDAPTCGGPLGCDPTRHRHPLPVLARACGRPRFLSANQFTYSTFKLKRGISREVLSRSVLDSERRLHVLLREERRLEQFSFDAPK